MWPKTELWQRKKRNQEKATKAILQLIEGRKLADKLHIPNIIAQLNNYEQHSHNKRVILKFIDNLKKSSKEENFPSFGELLFLNDAQSELERLKNLSITGQPGPGTNRTQ